MSAIEKLIEAAEACLEYKSGWSTAMAAAIAPARAEWEKMREETEQWRSNYAGALEAMNKVLDEASRLRAELAAERSVVMQLAGPKPVDPSRKAIVDAVEEWVNRARGGDATVDEIATALLEAATRAGWMVEPSAELAAAREETEQWRMNYTGALESLNKVTSAARAPMVTVGQIAEIIGEKVEPCFNHNDWGPSSVGIKPASIKAAAAALLPHLRPAAMPTEEEIMNIISRENLVEYWPNGDSNPDYEGIRSAARAILALLRDGGRG